MTTSPNDPAPTPAPAPTTPPTPDPQQQMATTMEKFVAAFIAEFSETPKPAALTDEWLVAYWTHGVAASALAPADCVAKATAILTAYRKKYPLPAA